MASLPEPWLRGDVAGIPGPLQPVAHALTAAVEDVAAATAGLSPAQLWVRPGGAPSVGWHLLHLAGSTDRLCAYARGETLSDAQKRELASETTLPEPPPNAGDLLARWQQVIDGVMHQLATTDESGLAAPRCVGRARLPSTVRGLLFHAAEHAQRHVGQIVTTARIVRGLGM